MDQIKKVSPLTAPTLPLNRQQKRPTRFSWPHAHEHNQLWRTTASPFLDNVMLEQQD